jgi:hypothetical protein
MSVCATCDHELPLDIDCHVFTFERPVGREGRHGGECWAGRFPMAEDMRPRREVDVDDEPLPAPAPRARQLGLFE